MSADLTPFLLGAMVVCAALIGWSLWRLARPGGLCARQDAGDADGFERPDDGAVPHESIVAALRSLEGFQTKESALRARLSSRSHRLAQRRAETRAAADLVRRSLHDIGLPQTLAALFDSLAALPGKPPHARAANLAWHALAGVQPLAIERWVCDHAAGQVEFCLGAATFSLGKQTLRMSTLVVREFTLCDGQGRLLAHVRTCGTRENPDVDGSVVTTCRPGAWVGLFCDLRLGMDERRATVLMMTRCGEPDPQDSGVSPPSGPGGSGSAP